MTPTPEHIERLARVLAMQNWDTYDSPTPEQYAETHWQSWAENAVELVAALEADGVCVGDHVAESIAAEAAHELAKVRAENERLRKALQEIEREAHFHPGNYGDSVILSVRAALATKEGESDVPSS